MDGYIVAHDLGTSGDKATLFSLSGKLVKSITIPYHTEFSNSSWGEQNPEDWWKAVKEGTNYLTNDIDNKCIRAFVCCGHMMGCLCVDKKGIPLHNSIIWTDMRAEEEKKIIENSMPISEFHAITGQRPSAAYTLPKLMWMKKHMPDIYEATYKVLLTKDYIVHRLTGRFVTDHSDASGTMAYDLINRRWSEKVIELAELDFDIFPEILNSTDVVGEICFEAASELGLKKGTPVVLGGGDGRCSSVGAGNVSYGKGHVSLGTSAWAQATVREPIYDEQIRLTNWAHIVPGFYVTTGPSHNAGSTYNWFIEQFCGLETQRAKESSTNVYEEINQLIETARPGSNGLIFLPYLLGERSPRWNPDTHGAFIGLKMKHNRADICRSVVEGIAYNLCIIMNILRKDVAINSMGLVGGMAKGAIIQQIMADVFGIPLNKLKTSDDAASIGAAVTAGVGIGAFSSFERINDFIEIENTIQPDLNNHALYKQKLELFDKSYYALYDIFTELARSN